MRYLRLFGLIGLVLGVSLFAASNANAQRVAFGVGIGAPAYYGAAPVCTYGYYDYYPYACAPYGYYGPDWFVGGVFIGAGPWYRGYWGRGGYGWGRGYYGGVGYRGGYGYRGGVGYARTGGYAAGGHAFAGGAAGGYHGGGAVGGGYHGGGGFSGGGGFHGGGGGFGGGHGGGGGGHR
jgi:hypothetical protein